MRAIWSLMLAFGLSGGAHAGPVVELFTSQGCSSCPPADEIAAELAQDDDVIVVSYHVDYWNYLGWHDTHSDPAFTERQKAYAHYALEEMIYTPQIIVNGRARVVGSRGAEVASAVMSAHKLPFELELAEGGTRLRVAARAGMEPQIVQIVPLVSEARVDIRAGENAGRTITYVNVATGVEELAQWDPAAPLDLALPDVKRPAVILIQDAGPGAMRGALRLD